MTPTFTEGDLLGLLPAELAAEPVERWLAALEARLDAGEELGRALVAAHAWTTAADGLGTEVGGVRRDKLVRCDPWTTTWHGADAATGALGTVRVLRPAFRADPVARRALEREGRRLAPVIPGIRVGDGFLKAPLPGAVAEAGMRPPEVLARSVGGFLRLLSCWADRGITPPAPSRDEVREGAGEVGIVVLTTADGGFEPALRALAVALKEGTTPLHEVLASWVDVPPDLPGAVSCWQQALAAWLTARRHALLQRWYDTLHSDRRARLSSVLNRMFAALPPPEGTAVVGLDLEGRTLVVESRAKVLKWRDGEVFFDAGQGFDAPEARRVLRARASAPLNRRLHQEHGADVAFTEALCRWVAAALKLRTMVLLLEAR